LLARDEDYGEKGKFDTSVTIPVLVQWNGFETATVETMLREIK